jgi:hypothetical protein
VRELRGNGRPGLVVTEAGPTDLTTIQGQGAYNPTTGLYDFTLGSRWVHNLGAAAFGEENLATYSPARQTKSTLNTTRVLQAFAADDTIVPYQQATNLTDALRRANPTAYVDNAQLPKGTIPFGHGRVTQAAFDDFRARERRLVAPITTPTIAIDKR